MKEKYPEDIGFDANIYVPEKINDLKNIDEVKKSAEKITDREVEYVERNFWEKISRLKGKFGFKRDLIALYKFMKDPRVSFVKKAIAVFALLYFIIPLDSIPDISPIVGFLDDIGVVMLIVRYLSKELEPYYD